VAVHALRAFRIKQQVLGTGRSGGLAEWSNAPVLKTDACGVWETEFLGNVAPHARFFLFGGMKLKLGRTLFLSSVLSQAWCGTCFGSDCRSVVKFVICTCDHRRAMARSLITIWPQVSNAF